jgi:hypothetical protein
MCKSGIMRGTFTTATPCRLGHVAALLAECVMLLVFDVGVVDTGGSSGTTHSARRGIPEGGSAGD